MRLRFLAVFSTPRIPECNDAVEDQTFRTRVHGVGHEITQSFKLEAFFRCCAGKPGFGPCLWQDLAGARVEVIQKIPIGLIGSRIRSGEQSLVEAHFNRKRVAGRNPMDDTLDLASLRFLPFAVSGS